jgi:hypothetical protein
MNISKNEALKEIRLTAKKAGLVFKQTNTRLNGAYLYKLEVRETGEVVMSNYSFWCAYEDTCNGFISSWDGSTFVCGTRKNG